MTIPSLRLQLEQECLSRIEKNINNSTYNREFGFQFTIDNAFYSAEFSVDMVEDSTKNKVAKYSFYLFENHFLQMFMIGFDSWDENVKAVIKNYTDTKLHGAIPHIDSDTMEIVAAAFTMLSIQNLNASKSPSLL